MPVKFFSNKRQFFILGNISLLVEKTGVHLGAAASNGHQKVYCHYLADKKSFRFSKLIAYLR